MPDISMCVNDACPSAAKCYRHEAKPTEFRQAYSEFSPPEGRDKCDWFMPIWTKEAANG
jgi:hypothetical protein